MVISFDSIYFHEMTKQVNQENNNSQILQQLGYNYLNGRNMHQEVKERIRCAQLWCHRHKQLLVSPYIPRRIKFQLYKFFVRPILTYGCEFWRLDSRSIKNLLNVEFGILQDIYKSKYPLRHPKRIKPKIQTIFDHFRECNIIQHIRLERLMWDKLIKGEENFLRQKEKQIRWWDQ